MEISNEINIEFSKKSNLYLCLDIGGSKIAAGIFEKNNQNSLKNLIYFNKKPNFKGKEGLIKSIKKTINAFNKNKLTIYPIISIGTPGKLINGTTLCPGSAENLASFNGEFDNCNIKKLLSSLFNTPCKIMLENDAVLQCLGSIHTMLNLDNRLIDKKIGYIGPGTGLGGAFCYVNTNKEIEFFSDGHIYDILLENTNKSIETYIQAENLISGRAFFEQYGISSKEVNKSIVLLKKYKNEIEKMGNNLAQLIMKINSGHFKKINTKNNWPINDLEKVKDTTTFLLGGSLGSEGEFSKILLNSTKAYLQVLGLNHIDIFKVKNSNKAALLGGFLKI